MVADIAAFTSITAGGSTVHILKAFPAGAAAATTATVVPCLKLPPPLPLTAVTVYAAPLVLVLVLVLELELDEDELLVLEDVDELLAPELFVEVVVPPLDEYSAITDKSLVTFEKSALHEENVYPECVGAVGAVAAAPGSTSTFDIFVPVTPS